MCKHFAYIIFASAFFFTGSFPHAQEILTSEEYSIPKADGVIFWYRSNSSGLALEYVPSRLAALRNEYCLSVEKIRPSDVWHTVPDILLPYYSDLFSAELRIIYENGKEYRRQWIFRDSNDYTQLTASGSRGFLGGEIESDEPGIDDSGENNSSEDKVNPSGFIEIRNSDGSITKEMRFEDDLSEWEYRYFYREKILLSAETLFKGPPAAVSTEEEYIQDEEDRIVFVPVSTDYYRYSRSGSLRAIDRILHEGKENISRSAFPRLAPGLSLNEDFFSRGNDYSSAFLQDAHASGVVNINYTLDSRGRILTEVWKDEDGVIVGEFRNTWSGDRLVSVLWKSDDDERLVEYEYDDDGDRIVERNFRQGILERSVTGQDGIETEEIYMGGRVILRAYWEKGQKISEERVTPGGTGNQRRPRTEAPGRRP